VLASHPPTVYLREKPLRDEVNEWIGRLFAPENVDNTIAELLGTQEAGRDGGRDLLAAAKKRLASAEERLRRHQAAIEAGIDPMALVEVINQAQAERAAARSELDSAPVADTLSEDEIREMINSLGDIGAKLSDSTRLGDLYKAFDLQVSYDPAAHEADVAIIPVGRVNSARVRGGT
jgi:hypothetical protein